jgi:dsDNA-specific endonuclease/ATPase MutS2
VSHVNNEQQQQPQQLPTLAELRERAKKLDEEVRRQLESLKKKDGSR